MFYNGAIVTIGIKYKYACSVVVKFTANCEVLYKYIHVLNIEFYGYKNKKQKNVHAYYISNVQNRIQHA